MFRSIRLLFLGKNNVETPLGKVIAFSPNVTFPVNNLAHAHEHSLEVQLPFLQMILKNFYICPILINNINDSEKLATAIENILDDETIIVISSDLSHYLPLEKAQQIDGKS